MLPSCPPSRSGSSAHWLRTLLYRSCCVVSSVAHSSVPVAQQQKDWACYASVVMWQLCVDKWLSSAASLPLCFIGPADEKRVSSPSMARGSMHSLQTLLGVCRHDCMGQHKRADESTAWMQTCGAAKWQFSAGKEDVNHKLRSAGVFWDTVAVPVHRNLK